MNPNRRVFITVISFVVAMVVIACSCTDIIPNIPGVNPMPGLEGTWNNPDTGDVYQFSWQDGKYVVLSCTWMGDTYEITSQSWSNSTLTWSYLDTYYNDTVTVTTNSLSGDSLAVTYSGAATGTATLQRGEAAVVNPGGTDSLSVTSSGSGVVTSATGVTLSIPSGAVPVNDDGTAGEMIFTIAEDTTTIPSLPGGYVPAGPVVALGPEGFTFETPVTISIPIADGMDPALVMGGSYFDSGQGVWVLVPGSVDAARRTVDVSTTHLSIWTSWGLSPEMPEDNVNYGSFKIYRPSSGLGYSGPEYTYSNATTGHGICIRSIDFADPSMADRWDRPENSMYLVDNYWGGYTPDDREQFGKYRVPVGSYQLTEVISQSEINPGDPTYVPHFYQVWRDLGTVNISGGQTMEFAMPDWNLGPGEWTLGRPPCWGTVTTSVHTGGEGGVQVTLNWNANADLDLHVIEPDGTEIYYINTLSSSGGELDRDNQCSDFVLGRPENIYWTTPPEGTYQVNVVYYGDCGDAGAVNFTVRVCKYGNCTSPMGGTVSSTGDTANVTTFTIP